MMRGVAFGCRRRSCLRSGLVIDGLITAFWITPRPPTCGRRPRLDYESHATALDRNELGALLVAAGLRLPLEPALISLLALNGLRVSGPPALTSSTWASSVGTGP